MRLRFALIFSVIIVLTVGFSAAAYYNPGKATGFVNDYAGLLNADQIASLNAKLLQFNTESTNEITVVTISSLQGDTIENFANKLFTDWGIGQAKTDNGILLLVSSGEHQMRIEVGYGLEGALPDATSYQIITKTLKPAFQANDYYGGINAALDQIIAATRGEYQATPAAGTAKSSGLDSDSIFFLIFLLLGFLNALWRHLAKSRAWWEGGLIGIVIGLLITAIFFRSLINFIFIPAGVGVFGLIMDYLVSRVLPKPKTPKVGRGANSFWFFGGPGGRGGGGFGGGGFGGFGGGSSGGGGASGSW